MTKKKKIELVSKFLKWLSDKNCEISVNIVPVRNSKIKVCSITQMSDGKPLNTICYETFRPNVSDIDCWIGVLTRRCSGVLLFDRFDIFGLGKAETMEELALKLEITDA